MKIINSNKVFTEISIFDLGNLYTNLPQKDLIRVLHKFEFMLNFFLMMDVKTKRDTGNVSQ